MSAIVLNTRPASKAQPTTEMMRSEGFDVVDFPVIEIRENRSKPPVFPRADKVIYISTSAVEFGTDTLPEGKPLFSVGEGTAKALKVQGLEAEVPDDYSSEGLLELDSLQDVAGQEIVIVRGRGGREHLAETLRERGARVTYYEVYQRLCGNPGINDLDAFFASTATRYVLGTSKDVLEYLEALVPSWQIRSLRACHLVAMSKRVKEKAEELGWTNIHLVEQKSDAGMVSVINAVEAQA